MRMQCINGLCYVVRRRDVNEAKRVWTNATTSKRMKLDNYFNRQFTDHISIQNATLVETDGDSNGKWMWTVPSEASKLSMGIIRMDPYDAMSYTRTGPQLLCLSEMSEWDRLATVPRMGLIEWRLMGHTMVPAVQAAHGGLDHDCSTWDQLYEGDDGEDVHAWNAPASSTAAMPKKSSGMTSSGSATVLSQVANALNPGAEVVLRMHVDARTLHSHQAREFEK